MDESSWVTRAMEGDKDAFSLLVIKYDAFLKAIISYYIEKRFVEDLAQDLWLLIYQKLWQLEDPEKFIPWVRKVVYYQCANYRKVLKKKRQQELYLSSENWSFFLDHVLSDTFSLYDLIERFELRKEISDALDELPGDLGMILRLRYYQECSYQEITDLTNLPLSTIKWRIFQAKKLLRMNLLTKLKMKGRSNNG
ncbi:RNA polymerase sigma factor [Pullulanibacillus pueri]|uniref:DNA-directed RNA polymerase sigma-70 factor n=1 Tax=Pullulanibacillus pueri TaxID=1437324 RepID=A0A8J2ZYS0_9BACL|nr:RNA polymerase sigma factor [Pullulanibacillus pueri]GGH87123.1 DNA-directed RNA polymerase sigma-70 factor [Pullulanibacillus pueri]